MPQSIFVQVGQCGNQVGYQFWELAFKEFQHYNTNDEDASNFFKLKTNGKKYYNDLSNGKARAILVDMEEGVVAEILKSPLRRIFDRQQLITDVSGSGNNWAVGNKIYGSKYRSLLIELFNKEVEECDSLQCFFLLHSMGGGTGSGLGTAALECLHDEYPKIPKFVCAAFPSPEDDVITSPYNAVLANSQLISFADCVFPFQNKALIDVCNSVEKKTRLQSHLTSRDLQLTQGLLSSPNKFKAFDEMNEIIANMLLNLTCSSRFSGSLNVDINEIVLNMTPYPRLHYLIPSISPLTSVNEYKIDKMFAELFVPSHQLFRCCLSQGLLLAATFLCRGKISMSDVQSNIERMKGNMKFVPWNREGWKIGLCNIPQINSSCSALMLSNSSSISNYFSYLLKTFFKMYRKKAHLHHFLEIENMEIEAFESAIHDLEQLIEEYNLDFGSLTTSRFEIRV